MSSTILQDCLWASVAGGSFYIDVCQDFGHMASSTKRCDDYEKSSFCVAFGSLGFFLTSTFPALKTPPGLHSVAKCFAASAQHSCLWKNKTLKTAETLYESIFSSMRFWEHEHDQWNHAGGFATTISTSLSLKMQPQKDWLTCGARCVGSEPPKCPTAFWGLVSSVLAQRKASTSLG